MHDLRINLLTLTTVLLISTATCYASSLLAKPASSSIAAVIGLTAKYLALATAVALLLALLAGTPLLLLKG